MAARVALVTVAVGAAYERYAAQLFLSANDHFRPCRRMQTVVLRGSPGWPDATLYRYHAVLKYRRLFSSATHVFLCDADMRFEGRVGSEILADGITATLHPGFVGKHPNELPYEQRPDSTACVELGAGSHYHCGGFVGGERHAFLSLAQQIAQRIDADRERGVVAVWHDESQLNAALVERPPALRLSPAYCHPDNDDHYRGWWPEEYPRLLVALDKTADERGDR